MSGDIWDSAICFAELIHTAPHQLEIPYRASWGINGGYVVGLVVSNGRCGER